MKKTATFSIDADALERAKLKTSNLSKYVNECLIGLAGKTQEERSREQLEEEIEYLRQDSKDIAAREAIVLEALRQLKYAKIEHDKEELENEQYNRWNCGACHNLNFMDQVRCSRCNLPTRNDTKTTVVNIKGE